MSMSGITIIERVKFKVGANEKEYFVDKVRIKKKPVGKVIKMADDSYRTKIRGYHLAIEVLADDVVQDSGTTEDFIALQAEIEDDSSTVYFYTDASQSENYEVININLNESILYETDFDTRVDTDFIVCNTKEIVDKADIEFYKKF
jgi:hypothetical protein